MTYLMFDKVLLYFNTSRILGLFAIFCFEVNKSFKCLLTFDVSEQIFFNQSAWVNGMLLNNDFGFAEAGSKKSLQSVGFQYIIVKNLFFSLFL